SAPLLQRRSPSSAARGPACGNKARSRSSTRRRRAARRADPSSPRRDRRPRKGAACPGRRKRRPIPCAHSGCRASAELRGSSLRRALALRLHPISADRRRAMRPPHPYAQPFILGEVRAALRMPGAGMDAIFDSLRNAGLLIVSGDPTLLEIVALSLAVSLSAVVLATLLGLPLGAAIGVLRFPGRRALIVILNALMGLPPVVVGLVVYLVLSRAGPLGELGLLFTPPAMVIAQTVLILPAIAPLRPPALQAARAACV